MAYRSEPIRVGTGRAQVLNVAEPDRYIDPNVAANAKQAEANKKGAENQDKAFDEMMDIAPEYGWQPHDEQIQGEVDNYRNKIAGWRKQGGDMTDPDFQRVVKAEQERIGLMARKSSYNKDVYDEERNIMKGDDRYKKNAPSSLDREIYKFDDDGYRTEAKSLDDISVDGMRAVKDNYHNFEMDEVYKGIYDNLPDHKENLYYRYNPNKKGRATQKDIDNFYDQSVISRKNETTYDGKFFRVENGKTIINTDTPEGRDLIMEDEFFQKYHDQSLQEGVPEEDIWQGITDYMRGGISEIKKSTDVRESEAQGKTRKNRENQPDAAKSVYTMNFKTKEGTKTANMYTPHDIDIQHISKADRTVQVEVLHARDMESGEWMDINPGDAGFTITNIRSAMWASSSIPKVPGKKGVAGGDFVVGERDEAYDKQLSHKQVGMKWFAQGTYTKKVNRGQRKTLFGRTWRFK